MLKDNKIILLGGSAGGFSSILSLLKNINQPLFIPIIVIIHRNAKYSSSIEETLSKTMMNPVKAAEDKEKIKNGIIYFAPAGYHLLIEPDFSFSLDVSEPVQYSRPSIDVTFESAAEVYGQNCTAILFSGANQDGASGLLKVKKSGGMTIVQDPGSAEVPTMPEAAIQIHAETLIYTIEEIRNYIVQYNLINSVQN